MATSAVALVSWPSQVVAQLYAVIKLVPSTEPAAVKLAATPSSKVVPPPTNTALAEGGTKPLITVTLVVANALVSPLAIFSVATTATPKLGPPISITGPVKVRTGPVTPATRLS